MQPDGSELEFGPVKLKFENGVVKVTIDGDLLLEVSGSRHDHSGVTHLQTAGADLVRLSGVSSPGVIHDNPASAELYDRHVRRADRSLSADLMELMSSRAKQYQGLDSTAARRAFYAEALRPRPLRKKSNQKGKCSCA